MNNLFITLLSLGIVQGASEFLPISSSGHLVIFEMFPFFHNVLDAAGNDLELFVNVSLHLATLGAVIIYLWKDIGVIIKGVFSGILKKDYKRKEIYSFTNIIAASIPAGIIGLLLHDTIESLFTSNTTVFFMLILNGFLLLSTKIVPIKNRSIEEMGLIRSIFVGVFQALAILPGISRSGSTITGGMFFGLAPEEAARFSFLISIPAIAGAGLIELLKLADKDISHNFFLPLSLAMVVTFIVGLISLKILFSLIRRVRIDIFGYYTLILGIGGILYLYL
ncbi:MAG: undecaprenyl-diphosphate phosphatase [Spirochaetota bacterium]|nr:undecaprenyl-diphosphate phosphatase [Spirochaetota bacterium]